MIGVLQYSVLVIYQVVVAVVFKAFSKQQEKGRYWYLFFTIMPLAIMTMFHGGSVGNDTQNYIYWYGIFTEHWLYYLMKVTRIEPLFRLLNIFLSRITSNPQILFITVGFAVYVSFWSSLKKYVKSPGLLLCVFVQSLTFDDWITTVRQTMAVAILFIAFDASVKKKPFVFFGLVVIAAGFHRVSWAFLLIYCIVNFTELNRFLTNFHLSFETIIACVSVGFVLLYRTFIKLLLRIFPAYSGYFNSVYMDGNPRLAVILDLIVFGSLFALSYIVLNRKKDWENDNYIRHLYYISILNLAFIFMANRATLLTRISNMLMPFSLMYITEAVSCIENKSQKRIVLTMILTGMFMYGAVITYFKTPEWYTTYPFVFCWQE